MPRKKRPERTPLILRVCAELGAGRIDEGFIAAKHHIVHGLCESGQITVNPVHFTLDTVVHECLHRLHPEWSENYVRNRTSFVTNQLSDAEKQTIYGEYQARVTRRKTAKRLTWRG